MSNDAPVYEVVRFKNRYPRHKVKAGSYQIVGFPYTNDIRIRIVRKQDRIFVVAVPLIAILCAGGFLYCESQPQKHANRLNKESTAQHSCPLHRLLPFLEK